MSKYGPALLALALCLVAPALWATEATGATVAAESATVPLETKGEPVVESCSAVMYCASYRLSCTGCPADSGTLSVPSPLKGVWVECAGAYQDMICCPSSPWPLSTCATDSNCAAQCSGYGTCVKPPGYGYGCCQCGVEPPV
jgi:hypothetical protein